MSFSVRFGLNPISFLTFLMLGTRRRMSSNPPPGYAYSKEMFLISILLLS